MSSVANDEELSGDRQLLADSSNTTNQKTPSPSAEMNSRAEVVEGLNLIPVPPGSTWLEHDSVNEYVQLFNAVHNFTDIDCSLLTILKDHGDPLAEVNCSCHDNEDHTCWLSREFCGTRGKHGHRRSKLVNAFEDAVYALKNGLLQMYRHSTIYGNDSQNNARQAGLLTPGLHKLATTRLSSLTNGFKRLQEYHDVRASTASDESKAASSASNSDTDNENADDESPDDSNSDGSLEDLADLERRLLACKADLLTPLERVPNTKASIVKATQDLKLAARTYDHVLTGPRSTVRGYYNMCVLKVADANPSLEHYAEHKYCDGLGCDLEDIDNGYRNARNNLYRYPNSDELSDGLGDILRSLWDKTRSCFEASVGFDVFENERLSRPDDLELDSDDETLYSDRWELDGSEYLDENAEDDERAMDARQGFFEEM